MQLWEMVNEIEHVDRLPIIQFCPRSDAREGGLSLLRGHRKLFNPGHVIVDFGLSKSLSRRRMPSPEKQIHRRQSSTENDFKRVPLSTGFALLLRFTKYRGMR